MSADPAPVLSVAVMCHPSRRAHALGLIDALAPYPVRLVEDPEPDGPPRTLRTAWRAWAAVGEDATHHLVMQDDAVPAPDFLRHVTTAIQARPSAAIALHSDWGSRNGAAVRMAATVGAHWVRAVRDYVPTIALALPAGHARGLARFLRRWPDPAAADDQVLIRYRRDTGVAVYLTVPNLVGHRDVPSVVGNHGKGRREAACFPGAPPAGWNADARRTVDTPDLLPYFKHGQPRVFTLVDPVTDDWRLVNLRDGAGRLGLDVEDLRRRYRRDLREARVAGVRAVPNSQLWGVWVTCCLMAVARSGASFRVAAGATPPDPGVLDEALRTVAPGGCFPVLSHAATADFDATLHAVARAGFGTGQDLARRPAHA